MIPENFVDQYKEYRALDQLATAFDKKPYDSDIRRSIVRETEFSEDAVYGVSPDAVDSILKEEGSNRTSILVETTKTNLEDIIKEVSSKVDERLVIPYLLSLKEYEGSNKKYKSISDSIKEIKESNEILKSKNLKAMVDGIKESTGLDKSIDYLSISNPERIGRVYEGIINIKARKLMQEISNEEEINRRLILGYAKATGVEDKPESYLALADLAYTTTQAKEE